MPAATPADLTMAFFGYVTPGEAAHVLRTRLAMTADGSRTVRGAVSGRGKQAYRRYTDERITLSSGVVLGGLPWPAARTAEVWGEVTEAMKAVLFSLAVDGHKIVGFEPEAIWVTGVSPPDPQIEAAMLNVLRPFIDPGRVSLIWSSPG